MTYRTAALLECSPAECRSTRAIAICARLFRRGIGGRNDQDDHIAEKRRALHLWEQRLMDIVEGRPAPVLRR
jgi:hypothetical protein